MQQATSDLSLIKTAAVAQILNVSEDAVLNLAHKNAIPHVRLGKRGRSYRFSATAVRQWIDEQMATSRGAGPATTSAAEPA